MAARTILSLPKGGFAFFPGLVIGWFQSRGNNNIEATYRIRFLINTIECDIQA